MRIASPGRGDSDGGAYQQLTLNLFLSEAEQIQSIDEAENVAHTSSAFSFAQNDIDHVLRLGGNTDRQRERVVAAFEKQKTTAEIAEILKTLYHGGNGLGSVSAWYAEDGIHLSHGKSVRYDRSAQVISWESAAERIGELLESGQFASNVELAEAAGYERSLLSEKLWYLYHDLSEDAREAGYLSCLSEIKGNGFPEETHRLTEQLSDPAFRQTLKEEYAAFWTAYQQDRDLLRFHYHRPREIWENLKELDLPRRTFSSDLSQVPTVQHFITEDEIDAAMTSGSSFAGGKGRIYAFFMENHTDKEKVRFLKDEYGIGGRSHGWLRNTVAATACSLSVPEARRKRSCPGRRYSAGLPSSFRRTGSIPKKNRTVLTTSTQSPSGKLWRKEESSTARWQTRKNWTMIRLSNR